MAEPAWPGAFERPFEGLKVVDLSQGVAGPHCGLLLAQYGAEVIKVEPPAGDWIRDLGTRYGDATANSAVYNLGKRGIVLDLKDPGGVDVVRRLARTADVFIESNRPGVIERLGLGYERLREDNPGLIYVSISGFGQDGPYRNRPCTDTVAQAFSGLMSVNVGADGVPHKVHTTIVDAITGLYAYQAVATALYARGRAGEGRHIDVSLMQCAAAIQAPKVVEAALEGGPPAALNSPAGTYRTADGWIAVTLVKESHFADICRVIGRAALADEPRYATFAARAERDGEIRGHIARCLATETTQEWVRQLRDAGVLAYPVFDYLHWLDDEHVRAVEAACEVDLGEAGAARVPRVPGHGPPRGRPPALGEHGREILAELGLSEDEIERLAGPKKSPPEAG